MGFILCEIRRAASCADFDFDCLWNLSSQIIEEELSAEILDY